jgi:hypothetical protein
LNHFKQEQQNSPNTNPEESGKPADTPEQSRASAEDWQRLADALESAQKSQQLLNDVYKLAFQLMGAERGEKASLESQIGQRIEQMRQSGMTDGQIKRELGKVYHPDAAGDNPQAEAAFKYVTNQLRPDNGEKK